MPLKDYISQTTPNFSLLAELTKKPILWLTVVLPTVVVSKLERVDIQDAAWVLFWLFVGDFITGLIASYFEWKKNGKKDRYFFGRGEGFSSDKFKKMFVKAIVYAGTPVVLFKFQNIFMIKKFSYETISNGEAGIATISLLLFCLNEIFSIFNENLPKCGFNLWSRIKAMIAFFKEIKKEVK